MEHICSAQLQTDNEELYHSVNVVSRYSYVVK